MFKTWLFNFLLHNIIIYSSCIWPDLPGKKITNIKYSTISDFVYPNSRTNRHWCTSLCEFIRIIWLRWSVNNLPVSCGKLYNVGDSALRIYQNVYFRSVQTTAIYIFLVSLRTISETFVKIGRLVFEYKSYKHCTL